MENKIVIAVKGIIVNDNKVLIIQRSSNDEIGADTWEFVGGKMDFGERLEEALRREITEEVALDVSVDKLLYATTFKTDEHRQVVILTYLCVTSNAVPTLSFEHKNYLWANKEEMMGLLSKPIVDDLNNNDVWDTIFAK